MTNYKATVECKNYRKSISSLKALRPLFSDGLLNLIRTERAKDCSLCVGMIVVFSYLLVISS